MDLRNGRFSHKNSEKFVFQQPGLFVGFVGILIASIIGLSVRSYFSPERVREKITEAAQHIHKNVKVTIDEAYLSLSDGYLPQFAIVLKQVTFESEQACWLSPLIQIDQMRLPISFWSMLRGEPQVDRLISHNVSVKLRKSREECVDQQTHALISEVSLKSEKKSPSLEVSDGKIQIPKNVIQSVEIQNLNLSYFPMPQYQLEMENIRFQLKSFDPRIIVLRAVLNSGADQWLGDHQSKTTILMEYSESAEPTLKTQISGQWREGYYELNSNYKIPTRDYDLSISGKHLPLLQMTTIMRKYQMTQIPLNGKNNWLSFQAKVQGNLQKSYPKQFQIEEAKLEGDIGEISSRDILITQFSPLQIQATVAELKNINVDELLLLLGKTDQHPTIHTHGYFNGLLNYESRKNISITGVHTGLEFIFSNKGRREYQKINQLKAQIAFLGRNWMTKISEVNLNEGSFEGEIDVSASRDWQDVELKLNLNKGVLAPNVQNLISSGGTLGEMSGDLNLRLNQGQLNYIQGRFQNNLMSIDGVTLQQSTISLKTIEDLFHIQLKSPLISIQKKSNVLEKAQVVFDAIPIKNGDEMVSFKNLDAMIKTKKLEDLSWTIQPLREVKDQYRLTTSGAWQANQILTGMIQYQNIKVPTQKIDWTISGTRSSPEIIKKVK